MPPRPAPKAKPPPRRAGEFPPQSSSGYLVRDAHRGQWYFLRVLWITDGLSQRELSARVGMMEPTTVIALRSMEKSGLIRRVRGDDDRRKVRVFLTAKAKRLRGELLGVARTITAEAEEGIAPRDLAAFRRIVARMTKNLDRIER
jgi:DNA-binding MarR family transcriptional regulator